MNIKTQSKWFGLLCTTLALNYVIYDNFFKPEMGGYWSKNQNHEAANRNPAALDLSRLPSADEVSDFFQFDNYGGSIKYNMDLDFWSDKGEEYFKKNATAAIKDGFQKTFDEIAKGEKGKKLPVEAKSFITKEMLNRFVYTLKAVKLIDANFEVDLTFTPSLIQGDYSEELKSNQLVNLSDTGNLMKAINDQDESFTEKLLKVDFPDNGDTYQYIGGAITISAEILDTNWKITQPIPKPKKNAVKGQIRLRKYYRVNDPGLLEMKSLVSDKDINFEMTHFKLDDNSKTPYITVDKYFEFNLEDLIPTPKNVVVSFGTLLGLDKRYDNIIKRVFRIFKKSSDIDTSNLYISGKVSSVGETLKFKSKIKTLVYDVESKSFTSKSKIVTTASSTSANNFAESKIEKSILSNDSSKIIEALRLEKIIK